MNEKGLIFMGNNSYLQGVPARNLTHSEVISYGGYELLLKSGLYQLPLEVPAEKPKKAKSEEVNNG